MSKMLKSHAASLSETKNQQEGKFDMTCCVHTCICKKAKNRKSNDEKCGDKEKKARFIIGSEKQRLISVCEFLVEIFKML